MRRTRARYILRTTETRRPARDGEVLVEATNHSADLGWLGPTALTASTIFLMALFLSRPALAEPAAIGFGSNPEPSVAVEVAEAPSFETLERLLAVPAHHDVRSEAERTDEFLAVVIEQSLPASLARPSAFRKRNLDLFRTERGIEVGRQEMLVRLRLRAKSRETMSVEFRF